MTLLAAEIGLVGVLIVLVLGAHLSKIAEYLGNIKTTLVALNVAAFDTVHYLDKEPDVELSNYAVSKLKELAARGPSPLVLPEEQTAYEAGLKDGVTELSKFVLEEMKETQSA